MLGQEAAAVTRERASDAVWDYFAAHGELPNLDDEDAFQKLAAALQSGISDDAALKRYLAPVREAVQAAAVMRRNEAEAAENHADSVYLASLMTAADRQLRNTNSLR